MIHAGAVEADQRRRKRVNLIVDAAQHIPGRTAVTELIDSGQPVVADCGREISEILNAAASVCHGAVDL